MKTPDNPIKKILIVEDEPVIERLCQEILAGEGYDADVAVNGQMADEMISKQNYDLFLIDIKMPIISGTDLYEWLKQTRPLSMGKVIFISGDVVSRDTRAFLEKTGRPFLAKPFSGSELCTAIASALKTSGPGTKKGNNKNESA